MLPAQPNRSLIDGLDVLQAVVGRRGGVGGRPLARELGLEPTRVNRLLKTLSHLGLCERGDDAKYRPGPGIHVLAAQSLFGSGLLRRAAVPLEALHRFGGAVALGVLWRRSVAYLYHAEPGMPAAAAIGRAGLFPAERSGVGLALLASRSDADTRERYAGSGGVTAVLASVRAARRRGYAVADRDDGRSLGVAVPGAPEPVAAVAFASRKPLSSKREAEVVDALRAAAVAIAEAPGDAAADLPALVAAGANP